MVIQANSEHSKKLSRTSTTPRKAKNDNKTGKLFFNEKCSYGRIDLKDVEYKIIDLLLLNFKFLCDCYLFY